MNYIKSCEFNIDTACVEVKLIDGSMVSIDCIAVENEYANNIYEVSELDYLIYNEPLSYVRLSERFPTEGRSVGELIEDLVIYQSKQKCCRHIYPRRTYSR